MKNWYVVTTKTGLDEQDRAENNLLRQMIETYNPKIEVISMKKGEVVTTTESVFPGYLFVQFDPAVQAAATINNSYGVRRLLTFGSDPIKMSDHVIAELKKRFDNKPSIIELPANGEQIEIKDGPFAGLTAVFKEPSGTKRSFLMVELLGGMQQIEIDNISIA
jgi:transcriptional antiterminator RfaH